MTTNTMGRIFAVRESQLMARIQQWAERQQSRRELLQLDEHLLKDIGLSREQAEREARKPFWVA